MPDEPTDRLDIRYGPHAAAEIRRLTAENAQLIEDVRTLRTMLEVVGTDLERRLVQENAELSRQWGEVLSEKDRLKGEVERLTRERRQALSVADARLDLANSDADEADELRAKLETEEGRCRLLQIELGNAQAARKRYEEEAKWPRIENDGLKADRPAPDLVAIADRVIAVLCWRKYVDESTGDTKWIARRYGELKQNLSFDEAERRAKSEWFARVLAEHFDPEAKSHDEA